MIRNFILQFFSKIPLFAMLFLGGLAIAFGVLPYFGLGVVKHFGIASDDVMLMDVGLICFTFPLIYFEQAKEHRRDLDRLSEANRKHLDDFLAQLRSRERVVVSMDTRQTYADSLPMVLRSTSKIEVLVSADGPKAPPEWIESLRQHMLEQQRVGNAIIYDVLILATPDVSQRPEFLRENKERIEHFRSDNLDIRVRTKDVSQHLGFNLIVVDGRGVGIAINPSPSGGRSVGLVLENCGEAALRFSNWFDRLALKATEMR
jgi:hypothetical protein